MTVISYDQVRDALVEIAETEGDSLNPHADGACVYERNPFEKAEHEDLEGPEVADNCLAGRCFVVLGVELPHENSDVINFFEDEHVIGMSYYTLDTDRRADDARLADLYSEPDEPVAFFDPGAVDLLARAQRYADGGDRRTTTHPWTPNHRRRWAVAAAMALDHEVAAWFSTRPNIQL